MDGVIEVREHHVPLRVSRRRDRVERAGADEQPLPVVEPGVRVGVQRHVRLLPGHHLLPPARHALGAGAQDHGEGRVGGRPLVLYDVQAPLLAEAQADVRAELTADGERLRVVVAVHVRDQEAGDVGGAVTD